MLRILIADDHALVRSGLQQLLGRLEDEVHCHEPDSAARALAAAREEPALDLVLLDLDLSDCRGLDLLARFVREFPLLPVVIVSATSEPAVIRGAIELGALGFILKSAPPDATLQAIRLVLAGEIYVPAAALHAPRAASHRVQLTARQRSVLASLVLGRTHKAIARELGLAEATVKVHVATILRTLEASNRTEAAPRARTVAALP